MCPQKVPPYGYLRGFLGLIKLLNNWWYHGNEELLSNCRILWLGKFFFHRAKSHWKAGWIWLDLASLCFCGVVKEKLTWTRPFFLSGLMFMPSTLSNQMLLATDMVLSTPRLAQFLFFTGKAGVFSTFFPPETLMLLRSNIFSNFVFSCFCSLLPFCQRKQSYLLKDLSGKIHFCEKELPLPFRRLFLCVIWQCKWKDLFGKDRGMFVCNSII